MRRREALGVLTAMTLLGCRRRSGELRVGSKNFSESVLLGEIIAQQLERRGVAVARKANLGGTFVCHQAIVSGDLDAYVEYTGTAFTAILRDERRITDPAAIRTEVERIWPERFGAVWMPPLGFDDTFAILIRRSDAEKWGAKTISDLAARAFELRPGFGYEFVERADGFSAFTTAYELTFREKPATMELSLTYRALAEGKVDVIAGNSTDGLIEKLDLVQLTDDRRFFPPYEAAPIVRRAVLDAKPGVAEALRALAGTISAETMRRLNRAVDVEGAPISEVAKGFLQKLS
jgi:glycine betaine/choline ABC-type transport system substrate-binding protein